MWRKSSILGFLKRGAALSGAVLVGVSSMQAADDAKGIEFFENKVRPLLVDRCFECHSATKKIKGGLSLDSKEAILKGGDTGASIVPGNPDKSLLIKAVRYHDENMQMPPKKKLEDQQIKDLEAWVKMGAPDPRTASAGPLNPFDSIMAEGRKHWAFQPVMKPAQPAVKNEKWVKSPIDAFVLAKLESKNMQPSGPADKRTLIRRAYFDLTGLPPTPEEVSAFLADRSPDAYEKVIDKLLASPRYGERWGRHWLDVARYADTKGYLAGGVERRFGYSYTYRDYVVQAFNEDLPYDQFVKQQIAADMMPLGEDKRPLAALGFITLGRQFLGNQNDIIDDRIDVVTRGLMGVTVACARCHDHKYDPIPTKDYYSLYGVFGSSTEPAEKPLLGTKPDPKENELYLVEHKKLEQKLEDFRAEEVRKQMADIRKRTGDYLKTAIDTKSMADRGAANKLIQERKLERDVVEAWVKQLDAIKTKHDEVFTPFVQLAALPADGFADKAKAITEALGNDAAKPIHPLIRNAFKGRSVGSLKDAADRYNEVFAGIENKFQEAYAAAKKKNETLPTGVRDSQENTLRLVLLDEKSPSFVAEAKHDILLDGARPKLRELKADIDRLDAVHPGAPARAMSLVDKDKPMNPVVFIRGSPGNRGAQVPRQFLEVLSKPDRKPFQKGSGRLELAEAIASKDNPLTARVLANRFWMLHFGNPLVRTTADFGVRSEPPTHPELLDFLASYFMENGWSMKKLHKVMMLSSTYMQSADADPALATKYAQVDATNLLLWKMNRQRLDFESMRDTILSISGKLDLKQGGLPVELTSAPFTGRRTVYGFIDRQNLPGMFRAFDFANPDVSTPQRFTTTVPQQALFFLNSPFIAEQAKSLMDRKEMTAAKTDDEKVKALYALAFQRLPSREEADMAKRYVAEQASPKDVSNEPVWQYGYGEIDEAAKKVKTFNKMPHFSGDSWQGSTKFPDDKFAYLRLTADGGHAGNAPLHTAIRRWVAPQSGTIEIQGALEHKNKQGNGLQGWIISSSKGLLKEGVAQNAKADMRVAKVEVKAGEIIDFIADSRKDTNSDSFNWTPKVIYTAGVDGMPVYGKKEWSAKADFGKEVEPQRLDAWEKYAQIVLLSNEVVFVD
ncbi:MAG TPA: PSD1 and planctomycete cytochrome C domain-containing protein [Verrucomicrobiae bacterium]